MRHFLIFLKIKSCFFSNKAWKKKNELVVNEVTEIEFLKGKWLPLIML